MSSDESILEQTKHPLSQAEFDAVFGRVPRLTVEVIIQTDDGLVLTQRSIEPCIGSWHIPGGTVRFGESLTQAVRRVARDELGVEVKVGRQLGYIEYPDLSKVGYRGWPVGIAFSATIRSGELTGSEQGEIIRCFRQLPDDIFPNQRAFLETVM